MLNYNFVLCAKSPELMGSLKYLNGLLRTIFEVITSFPSANIRTLSMIDSVTVFHLLSPFSFNRSLSYSNQIFLLRGSCLKNCVFTNCFVKNVFQELEKVYWFFLKRFCTSISRFYGWSRGLTKLSVQLLLQAQNVRHLHHCWRMSMFTVIMVAMVISLSYKTD